MRIRATPSRRISAVSLLALLSAVHLEAEEHDRSTQASALKASNVRERMIKGGEYAWRVTDLGSLHEVGRLRLGISRPEGESPRSAIFDAFGAVISNDLASFSAFFVEDSEESEIGGIFQRWKGIIAGKFPCSCLCQFHGVTDTGDLGFVGVRAVPKAVAAYHGLKNTDNLYPHAVFFARRTKNKKWVLTTNVLDSKIAEDMTRLLCARAFARPEHLEFLTEDEEFDKESVNDYVAHSELREPGSGPEARLWIQELQKRRTGEGSPPIRSIAKWMKNFNGKIHDPPLKIDAAQDIKKDLSTPEAALRTMIRVEFKKDKEALYKMCDPGTRRWIKLQFGDDPESLFIRPPSLSDCRVLVSGGATIQGNDYVTFLVRRQHPQAPKDHWIWLSGATFKRVENRWLVTSEANGTSLLGISDTRIIRFIAAPFRTYVESMKKVDLPESVKAVSLK